MNVLLLRLDAPLMSFGTVAVDYRRPSGSFPALSMIAGLLGAALGYYRHEAGKLQRLQERILFAARIDRSGEPLRDYQTVDLGQPWMDGTKKGVGWTTRGRMEVRRGSGENRTGTHIRYRDYWSNRVVMVALTLAEEDEVPVLDELATALTVPIHPLYFGRKSCPPAAPIFMGMTRSSALRDALERTARSEHSDLGPLHAQWPPEEGGEGEETVLWDRRDWASQVHTGSRVVLRGMVDPPEQEVIA